MKHYVIGNWKSHKTLKEAKLWFDEFARSYKPAQDLEVIIAPPFPWLQFLAEYLRELKLENVSLAAQDVSPFPKGPYTGAVPADMIKEMVDYVIIGHSERRRYFHETSQDVANKVQETVDAGLNPIVCVDRPYAMSQLTAINDIDSDNLLIAYGPVEALSVRIPDSPQNIEEAVRFITRIYPKNPVVYGGSLFPDNVADYLKVPGLSGIFLGESSLDAAAFAAICAKAAMA